MKLILVLQTGLATGLLILAVTFISNAIKSWNEAPSVTSGNFDIVKYHDQQGLLCF